ncbi:MAG: hypothetical protein NDJ89_08600 [Oligoflexia bacterium]|nr:hypothetical protein [Oligoflexia bacterium]
MFALLLFSGCESAQRPDDSALIRSRSMENPAQGSTRRIASATAAELADAQPRHALVYLRRGSAPISLAEIEEFSFEQGGTRFRFAPQQLERQLESCPESVREYVRSLELQDLVFCNEQLVPGAAGLFQVKLKSGLALKSTGSQDDFFDSRLQLSAVTLAL